MKSSIKSRNSIKVNKDFVHRLIHDRNHYNHKIQRATDVERIGPTANNLHAQLGVRPVVNVANPTTLLRCVSHAVNRNKTRVEKMYIYSTGKERSKIPTIKVTVNDVELEMFVDTGASTGILDETTFQKINRNNEITLKPSSKRLFAYGASDHLTTIGQFEGTIRYQGVQCCVPKEIMVLFLATKQLQHSKFSIFESAVLKIKSHIKMYGSNDTRHYFKALEN